MLLSESPKHGSFVPLSVSNVYSPIYRPPWGLWKSRERERRSIFVFIILTLSSATNYMYYIVDFP